MILKPKLYSMDEIAAICLNAGMAPWPAVTCVAIAWAESGGNAYAVCINDAFVGTVSYLSLDLGVWQTNTYWHSEISSRVALSPVKQIDHVIRIAKRVGVYGYVGYVWTAWSAYNANTHLPFVGKAYAAVKAAGGKF